MTGLAHHLLKGRRLLRLFVFSGCLLPLLLLTGCAHEEKAPSPRVSALLDAYPAGTIDSVEEANEVEELVSYEKAMLDYLYAKDMDECTKRFLVFDCYEKTQLRLRMDRAALKPLSIEADRFKRSYKVRMRDEALVDSQQESLRKAPERDESRRKYTLKEGKYVIQEDSAIQAEIASGKRQAAGAASDETRRYIEEKAGREASPPQVEEGAYTVGEPSLLKNPDTVLTPLERTKNVQEYELKQEESEARQANVQKKMEQTQAKREKHAAEKAKEPTRKQREAKD
ncbi:MAG: hypothetical protein LBM56_06145 [Burkholderiaceae bacterium]|jgi:hypothetical protein|nr:hypothetical protein [Burkholderiaceae bacterium]